jgi:glycerol-3-phosphate dehydrogenase
MKRQEKIHALQENPQLDVLIIGAGINGIGTFRDLALQGVRVAIVEKGDYGSGASAGSSHMLHGGIRYLENGEFRLVREALHERNLLLKNAPHYARPLPTTIPIFRWFSGIFNAPLKFVGLMNKPGERGAIVIKLGLMMYDLFTGSQQTMPYHQVDLKKKSLEKYPKLNDNIICTATYYDAYMPSPERLCLDLLLDGEADNKEALALNYMSVIDGEGDQVTLRDEITGDTFNVQPKVVVNAGGPWIDFVNRALEQKTRFIGGTKGSHIVVDHPELYEATGEHEIFFENDDGRIVLIFPYLGKVMIGTTDIRINDPEDAICTEEEIDYMLNLVRKVFPTIEVKREQIIYQFSGVRPLPASEDGYTGNISRDHSIRSVRDAKNINFPVHSLVGGKWTSYRAFSEETTDVVLQDLGLSRRRNTASLPIGGGKDYPQDDAERERWLAQCQQQTELPREQLETLLERYGTRASDFATFMSAENDAPLEHAPAYTRREVAYIVEHEQVEHISDVVLRRSWLAILGHITHKPEALREVGEIIAQTKGWDDAQLAKEIETTKANLTQQHGMRFA